MAANRLQIITAHLQPVPSTTPQPCSVSDPYIYFNNLQNFQFIGNVQVANHYPRAGHSLGSTCSRRTSAAELPGAQHSVMDDNSASVRIQ